MLSANGALMILSLLALACTTPEPPPPPEAPDVPALVAPRDGDCFVLPTPRLQSVAALPDGHLLLGARDHAGPADHLRLWRLDPKTGGLDDLGEADALRPAVVDAERVVVGRRVDAPDGVALTTRVVNPSGRGVVQLELRPLSGGDPTPLSAPGHDVTSFILRGEALIYAAGRRLWRVPLSGGAPEALAEAGMEVHAALLDGGLIADIDHEQSLQLGVLRPGEPAHPLGGHVDHVVVDEGVIWAQRHRTAPLLQATAEGTLTTPPELEAGSLLPSGWLTRPTESGLTLHEIEGDQAPERLRIDGADAVVDLTPYDQGYAALIGHLTNGSVTFTGRDEADLCLLPASGRVTLQARDLPRRFADAEAALAPLLPGKELLSLRVVDDGALAVLHLSSPGPFARDKLWGLAETLREALPQAPTPVGLLVRFPESGRYGFVAQQGSAWVRGAGVSGVIHLVAAEDLPLAVSRFEVTPERCAGEVQNQSEAPLSLEVECGPFGNRLGGWGYLNGTPPEMKTAVSPSPLPPGETGSFSVKVAEAKGPKVPRFTEGEAKVFFVQNEANVAALVALSSVVELAEGRPVRIERDHDGLFQAAGSASSSTQELGTPTLRREAVLLVVPAAFTEDEKAMRLLAKDAVRATQSMASFKPPLDITLRLADDTGRLWKIDDGRWVRDGERKSLGGLGLGIGGL